MTQSRIQSRTESRTPGGTPSRTGPIERTGRTGNGGLALRGLSKTFSSPQGPVRAVRAMDLDIAAGETVALLGPNGAGKSTTIDMVLGLTQPDAGTLSIFGYDPAGAIAHGAVGAMLQTGGLIKDLSVRELLVMLASLYPTPMPVDEVLELTELRDIAGRRTDKLSGGQTQRVRFAMALVSDPDLLILDEPTVAMDVKVRHAFWATIRRFATGGRTIIFATHYLEEADEFADRIVLMANGVIVADGPGTEIKARVGTRVIKATLPEPELAELARLPGVSGTDRRGEAVILTCRDSDSALRALLTRYPTARDIEVTGAGLEAAFLQLTSDDAGVDAGKTAGADPATDDPRFPDRNSPDGISAGGNSPDRNEAQS